MITRLDVASDLDRRVIFELVGVNVNEDDNFEDEVVVNHEFGMRRLDSSLSGEARKSEASREKVKKSNFLEKLEVQQAKKENGLAGALIMKKLIAHQEEQEYFESDEEDGKQDNLLSPSG
jgi:hypothetical protein